MKNQNINILNEHKNYIEAFLSYIKQPFVTAEKMSGGTQSFVYLVNKKYVVKINPNGKLKQEYLYSMTYGNKSPLLQKMLYCDKDCKYIVYNFVPGKHITTVKHPKYLRRKVFKFIKGYKNYAHFGFGDISQPHETWVEFVTQMFKDSVPFIKDVLSEETINYILFQIPKLNNYNFSKKLLHGDLRLNNFIAADNKFKGIIDPYPMIGDELYDKLFFIMLTPEITKLYNFQTLHKKLKQPKEKVKILSLIAVSVKLKRIIKYKVETHLIDYFVDLLNEVKGL